MKETITKEELRQVLAETISQLTVEDVLDKAFPPEPRTYYVVLNSLGVPISAQDPEKLFIREFGQTFVKVVEVIE